MRIQDKIAMGVDGLIENGPINIVILGDSVSHGALDGDDIDYETVYWNQLKKRINAIRPFVPVNMICAAIGGTVANTAISRLDTQVLNHNPDLVIVCFGLNDVNGTIESFTDSLKVIFDRCHKVGADVIFMTPNMLNTYSHLNTRDIWKKYSVHTADVQNSGKMDSFMEAARKTARDCGVKVCDCYSEWKKLEAQGEDITELLANYINHPIREMHTLFCDMLYDTIFNGECVDTNESSSTMYREQ
jgi:lysophospholipase L1-like esterase